MAEEKQEKTAQPLKGNFHKDATFARLLAWLHESGRTGTLSVTSGQVCKKVYMKEGEAVFASSNSSDDWLGVALVKAGKISLQQFDYSTEIMERSGKRHGAVLVDLGYISPRELFWAVKFQVREIIYSLFEYDRADYEFVEGRIPDEVITLMMSTGSLIYEGVNRIGNLIRIKGEMPPVWTTLQFNDDPMRLFQNVQFSPKDKKILSLVDGQRTIKQVIEDSWLNSFEAMKTVYVFWTIGILTEKKMESENITLDVLLHEPLPGEGQEVFAAKVAAFHAKLPQMAPNELLGLAEGASAAQIKKNYYRLAREFHPDRVFDSEGQQMKDKLVEIFDAVKQAYITLMRRQGPGGAQGSLSAPETDAAPGLSPETPGLSPETAAMRDGARAEVERLREAAGRDPLNPELWRQLARALCNGNENAGFCFCEEAERAMFEAIRLSPLDVDCYWELGYIYLGAGRRDEAKRQFEKALVLDPGNRQAVEGLKRVF